MKRISTAGALATVVGLLVAACAGASTPAAQPGSLVPASTAPAASPSATASQTVVESPSAAAGISGMFEADGKSLFIDCQGSGAPTFVLDAGEGGDAAAMGPLKAALAERGTACSYDRANIGPSGKAPTPRPGKEVVDDLHALLAAAAVPGPYVLVGHSAGGLFVQLYARTFPAEVSGVVAMNPVPPADPWLKLAIPNMSKAEHADEVAYYDGQNGESFDYKGASTELAKASPPPAVPFEMLISTIAQCDSPSDVCGRTYRTYEDIERAVAAGWPSGHFSQVAAGHDIFAEQLPAVLAVIDRVVSQP